jgi:hypothetical protein
LERTIVDADEEGETCRLKTFWLHQQRAAARTGKQLSKDPVLAIVEHQRAAGVRYEPSNNFQTSEFRVL